VFRQWMRIELQGANRGAALWWASSVLVGLALALVLAPSGWAAPVVETVSSGRAARQLRAAVDRQGNAVVVWEQGDSRCFIKARLWPVRGRTRTVTVAGPFQDCIDRGDPAVASGRLGFSVVWSEYRSRVAFSSATAIRFRTLGAAGALGRARTLGRSQEDPSPQVAVGLRGEAIVLWSGLRRLFARVKRAGQAGFGRTRRLTPLRALFGADIPQGVAAFGSDGRGRVAWQVPLGRSTRIFTRRLLRSGVWGPRRQIARFRGELEGDGHVRIALTNRLATIVWWREQTGSNADPGIVEARRERNDGRYGPTFALGEGSTPEVATDPRGRTAVVWDARDGSEGFLRVIGRSRLGPLRSHPGRGVMSVASDDAGRLFTGFSERGPDGSRAFAAELMPSLDQPLATRLFTDPLPTSDDPAVGVLTPVALAAGGRGRAVIAWNVNPDPRGFDQAYVRAARLP
jgi:hypothetical protein